MAEFDCSSIDQLIKEMQSLDLYDEETQDEVLNAEADVLVSEIQKSMSTSKFDLSKIARNVKKSKAKKTKGNRSVTVTVRGKNERGERNATVAFVLNYGRRKEFGEIVGEYFWTSAVKKAENPMLSAAEEVVIKKIKERGLF